MDHSTETEICKQVYWDGKLSLNAPHTNQPQPVLRHVQLDPHYPVFDPNANNYNPNRLVQIYSELTYLNLTRIFLLFAILFSAFAITGQIILAAKPLTIAQTYSYSSACLLLSLITGRNL